MNTAQKYQLSSGVMMAPLHRWMVQNTAIQLALHAGSPVKKQFFFNLSTPAHFRGIRVRSLTRTLSSGTALFAMFSALGEPMCVKQLDCAVIYSNNMLVNGG